MNESQAATILRPTAAAEVACRRRIRDTSSTEHVHVVHVVAQQLEVVQALATRERVEGDVEHVIGFFVRSMESKKLHSAIDLPVETDRLRHLVHQADAARGDRSHTRSDLIACSCPAQHWAAIVVAALVLPLEPSFNLAFETPQLSS